MGNYDNRLNKQAGYCVPCGSKPKQETKPTETQKETPSKTTCCKDFKITAITRVKDKVIITLDDCTFLEAGLDVLDESLTTGMEEDLATKIETLEAELKKLTDNLVDVTGLDGELSHLAINKSYKD